MIWLYDIHLLLEGMSTAELAQFCRLAVEKRIAGICLDGLKQTARCFKTAWPPEVVSVLVAVGASEPSMRYLTPGKLRFMLRDIRSLSSWRERFRLVKEHLLPPGNYMLRKYSVSRRVWLPALYVHRGTVGLWRLLRGCPPIQDGKVAHWVGRSRYSQALLCRYTDVVRKTPALGHFE